jgi:tetratricopeptide (TPR) repeat protein
MIVALAAGVALLGGSIRVPVGHAEPAPDAGLERAKDLYQSAEAAMKDGRFEDAIRDYGAAYDLSKDPALFYKIGHANERAGRCEVALSYYARYLREGKPTEAFARLTQERMAACGGPAADRAGAAGPPGGDPKAGAAGPAESGAAGAPASSESTASTAPAAAAQASVPVLRNTEKAAWILSGSAVALITLGGVLAYASSSSENDIRDLYVGFAGQPATFDAQTRSKYDDLIDQGHRYQHLSWGAFGLAGAAAAGAVVLFLVGGHDEAPPARRARVIPVVTGRGAGVAVTF